MLLAVILATTALPPAVLAHPTAGGPYDDNCVICQAKRKLDDSVPWLRMMADLRLRFYDIQNPRLDKHHPSHEMLWQRHRARVGASATPWEDLQLEVRLMGEPRHWCKPDSKDSGTHCEALFDRLSARWKKAFGLPLTFTVGRQDLKFGEGWV